MLKVKRIYDRPGESDGIRVLVDRFWPRGLNREKAKIGRWMKELAPSDNLRKWFGHKKENWEEFKRRYFEELKNKKEELKELKKMLKKRTVTLLFAAKDKERNNAQALWEFLKRE